MADPNINIPTGWTAMTSKKVGSAARDTSEPGGSKLLFHLDVPPDGMQENPIELDFLDISLPELAASAYSTQLLAQRKWATQGVSRIIGGGSITGTIECPCAVYELLSSIIGAKGTARIEVPNQGLFSQWRAGLLSVDGPSLVDGDRMTASLILTVTNTAPDERSEMGPVFGTYTPASPQDYEAGPTLFPNGQS